MVSLLAGGIALAAPAIVPIGGGPNGIGGLRLAALPGLEARLDAAPQPDEGRAVLRATFAKTGDERRLLALDAPVRGVPADVKALAVRCRLRMVGDGTARLVLVAFESDRGAWFRVGSAPLKAEQFADHRLSLSSFRKAAFAQDADEEIRWEQVERVWVALTLDGQAKGTFELSRAVLTSEPYRPTKPLKVTNGDPGTWSVGHDRAASAKITTPAEGPGDKPCMRLDYSFPGGRHMYVVPSTSVGDVELEGYKALRFTYKAILPKGIDGLLVMLMERGGAQYCAEPAPPATKEWKTITIPFAQFVCGTWSKDENNRLDLNDIRSVAIGLHGTTSETLGKGSLWAADVQFVP